MTKGCKRCWIIFVVICMLSAPALAYFVATSGAEEVQIAQCSDDLDYCIIDKAMLGKVLRALQYWYDAAKTCKAT
jgi:hypothetical protein